VTELAKMLREGQKIVFHCSDGITRSAVVAYAVLRSLGKTAAQAEELIVKSRYLTSFNTTWRSLVNVIMLIEPQLQKVSHLQHDNGRMILQV